MKGLVLALDGGGSEIRTLACSVPVQDIFVHPSDSKSISEQLRISNQCPTLVDPCSLRSMAEGVRFELTVQFPGRQFSRLLL